MRSVLIISVVFLLGQCALIAQQNSGMEAVLTFLGSDNPEDLDADEVERLEHLLEYPININRLDNAQLRSCGLFSAYQIAVLEDYVARHGIVGSFMELSLLDGFGEEFVRKITPFITLSVGAVNPLNQTDGVKNELACRGTYTLRESELDAFSYAMKYRIDVKGKLMGVFAASRGTSADSWTPSSFSGSLAWSSGKLPLRLVVGDFHARFGQGLVLWSNSFITSVTNPDTFMKKPSGISLPWSFTGANALTGIAAEYNVGRFVLSAMTAFDGVKTSFVKPHNMQVMPAVNVAWYCRYGQISLTNITSMPFIRESSDPKFKSGLDAAFCIGGVNLFGELAYDWTTLLPSVVAGSRFRVGERMDMALLLRALQKDEYESAVSGSFTCGKNFQGAFLSDVTYYPISKDKSDSFSLQFKSQVVCEISIRDKWTLKFRLSERIRTWGLPFRTDARADIAYTSDSFNAAMRVNVLSCDGAGILSYIEGGLSKQKITLYLRQGVFLIDDWDNRIYVYERDAPGSFNVPAMYGRGLWTSICASSRIFQSLRFYARASYISYPFMQKKKPGKAELKLQLQYRF